MGMGDRTRTWAIALLAAVGCKEPEPPPPREAIAAAAPKPEVETCRDWSTLDVDDLAPLTEGRHAALLDEVWRLVLQKHFDPTLGCNNWAELRQVYARKVAEATTDAQAYGEINALLGELGQSHLRLFAPTRAEDQKGPASPDLTVRWVEDQLVVVRSQAEGPQGPVNVGATLLAIGEVSVAKIAERVRARTEPHEFAKEVVRAAEVRLSCVRAGQTRRLKVTEPTKDQGLAIRIVPCVAPKGERITLGNLRDVPTRVEHHMVEGTKVGVLAFNVWMLPMVKRVRAGMEQLQEQGMRALVLDLRGNPGGVGAMAVPVARMLLTEDGSLGTMRFREFEQELKVELGDTPGFAGPVVVLVDEGTASTSEIFIMGLRDMGRVTVIGAHGTAGAALPSMIEQLGTGALLQYVVADYRSPKGTVVEGDGIAPDVHVVETRDGFVAGRDRVVEAAVAHLAVALTEAGPATADEPPPTPEDSQGSTGGSGG